MSAVLDPPAVAIKPPTLSPSDSLFEVVNGQRVELPEMSAYSHLIALRLYLALHAYLETARSGIAVHEVLFILDEHRRVQRRPDVAYVSFERWPADREIPETGDWEVVPDLAVEVVSPSDLAGEVLRKAHDYLRRGVAEVWLILPEEAVLYRYRPSQPVEVVSGDLELSGDPLLPGFRLKLADLLSRTLVPSQA